MRRALWRVHHPGATVAQRSSSDSPGHHPCTASDAMHGYRAVFRFGQYSDDIFQKTVGSGLRLIRKILRKLKTFWLFGAGPAALIATALIAPNVPEDWAARHSNGHPGIWTVTEVRCRSFCKSWGDFVPDDGTPGRQHVERAGDSELGPDEVGSRLPAIDVDARSHVPRSRWRPGEGNDLGFQRAGRSERNMGSNSSGNVPPTLLNAHLDRVLTNGLDTCVRHRIRREGTR